MLTVAYNFQDQWDERHRAALITAILVGLFIQNVVLQPCLGAGRRLNFLRSLSYALSCSVSFGARGLYLTFLTCFSGKMSCCNDAAVKELSISRIAVTITSDTYDAWTFG